MSDVPERGRPETRTNVLPDFVWSAGFGSGRSLSRIASRSSRFGIWGRSNSFSRFESAPVERRSRPRVSRRNPFIPDKIATVDLTTGAFTKFTGVGLGDVNGLAVDSSTGSACTTTEIDFSVEFYNLATQTGFAQPLPGATQQFFSGADVQFDPVNRLFLVAQPNSSTAPSGSSIHVYDVSGNLIQSINGLNFSNAFNVVPAHIALNPGKRIGFVDGPDIAAGQIQSFAY